MKRKQFLSTLLPAGLFLDSGLPLQRKESEEDASSLPMLPPYLREGDTIGITSPAGYITREEILPAVQQLESWGFKVKTGSTIGKREFTFGGTDEERTADFQQLINDPSIKAILCARGGYGFLRIIDRLDFNPLKKHPKWIIGFSDITVLHCHINRNYGIASLHSKMCNSFPADWSNADTIQQESILSIRNALTGVPTSYNATPHPKNRTGIAEGVLVGGNLKTIESLAGSKSDLRTTNKILFVEDTGEYLYSIDRMFWNLKRSGKLDHLAGLMIGGFKIKPSENPDEEFGKTLYEIVREKTDDCHFPICFDFQVGHQKNNFALKCGAKHRLTVSDTAVTLIEK